MVDGSALLASFLYGLRAAGAWQDERGTNVLDGGAPFYDTYATADGRHMAVGALEPKFYAELLAGLGLDGAGLPAQYDRVRLAGAAGAVRPRPSPGAPRHEWAEVFAGSDACVAPVVSPGRGARPPAQRGPRHLHRGGRRDPAGARAPVRPHRLRPALAAGRPGADTDEVLAGLGFSATEIARLRDNGAAT